MLVIMTSHDALFQTLHHHWPDYSPASWPLSIWDSLMTSDVTDDSDHCLANCLHCCGGQGWVRDWEIKALFDQSTCYGQLCTAWDSVFVLLPNVCGIQSGYMGLLIRGWTLVVRGGGEGKVQCMLLLSGGMGWIDVFGGWLLGVFSVPISGGNVLTFWGLNLSSDKASELLVFIKEIDEEMGSTWRMEF